MTDKIILGVDVAKHWLDIAVDDSVERIANDPCALAALLARHGPERIAAVAFEPTGGGACPWAGRRPDPRERALVAEASRAGIALRRVHPNALVAFRALHRVQARTDPIDARLIARYSASIPPRDQEEVTVDLVLKALVARRRQLRDLLDAEACRLAIAPDEVRASHERLIGLLREEIAGTESLMAARLDPAHQRLAPVLRAVKGVGPITAATLIADLPELGHRSAKSIAALAGLAPRTRESGTLRQAARLGHGRAGVRKVLFNAARSAIRVEGTLRDFFLRLTAAGKPGKLALAAAMRKLLTILNAKARDALKKPLTQTTVDPANKRGEAAPCGIQNASLRDL